MSNPTQPQRIVRLGLAVGMFFVWSWLMIQGRQLPPLTTVAILILILAMTGLGHHISDVTGRGNGDDSP